MADMGAGLGCIQIGKSVAILNFADWTSDLINVPAGVLQVFPVSPLLFCLFMVTLYDKLRGVNGVATLGFADGTNVLACSTDIAKCVTALKERWEVCEK